MGSAFHQLCPRYSGTLTPTAPTVIRLWDTFTFFFTLWDTCIVHDVHGAHSGGIIPSLSFRFPFQWGSALEKNKPP